MRTRHDNSRHITLWQGRWHPDGTGGLTWWGHAMTTHATSHCDRGDGTQMAQVVSHDEDTPSQLTPHHTVTGEMAPRWHRWSHMMRTSHHNSHHITLWQGRWHPDGTGGLTWWGQPITTHTTSHCDREMAPRWHRWSHMMRTCHHNSCHITLWQGDGTQMAQVVSHDEDSPSQLTPHHTVTGEMAPRWHRWSHMMRTRRHNSHHITLWQGRYHPGGTGGLTWWGEAITIHNTSHCDRGDGTQMALVVSHDEDSPSQLTPHHTVTGEMAPRCHRWSHIMRTAHHNSHHITLWQGRWHPDGTGGLTWWGQPMTTHTTSHCDGRWHLDATGGLTWWGQPITIHNTSHCDRGDGTQMAQVVSHDEDSPSQLTPHHTVTGEMAPRCHRWSHMMRTAHHNSHHITLWQGRWHLDGTGGLTWWGQPITTHTTSHCDGRWHLDATGGLTWWGQPITTHTTSHCDRGDGT